MERAIRVARELREEGVEIRGIPLDSGDLGALAHDARTRLADAGFPDMRVFASGGLDEHKIQRLVEEARAPIDGFGLGSSLGVSAAVWARVPDGLRRLHDPDPYPVEVSRRLREVTQDLDAEREAADEPA